MFLITIIIILFFFFTCLLVSDFKLLCPLRHNYVLAIACNYHGPDLISLIVETQRQEL